MVKTFLSTCRTNIVVSRMIWRHLWHPKSQKNTPNERNPFINRQWQGISCIEGEPPEQQLVVESNAFLRFSRWWYKLWGVPGHLAGCRSWFQPTTGQPKRLDGSNMGMRIFFCLSGRCSFWDDTYRVSWCEHMPEIHHRHKQLHQKSPPELEIWPLNPPNSIVEKSIFPWTWQYIGYIGAYTPWMPYDAMVG